MKFSAFSVVSSIFAHQPSGHLFLIFFSNPKLCLIDKNLLKWLSPFLKKHEKLAHFEGEKILQNDNNFADTLFFPPILVKCF
jgi:hypothetical protein